MTNDRFPRRIEWTDERRELVARMWSDGASFQDIADKLGDGISRGAVSGYIYRYGLRRSPDKAIERAMAKGDCSFHAGMRVRVNESFGWRGDHGRVGTITRIPRISPRQAEWIEVRFDDKPEYPVKWHRSYFDRI